MPSLTIDTRGMSCPLPVLKVRKLMRGVEAGTEVLVLATDPAAGEDLRAFCLTSHCKFLSEETDADGVLRILIQK